MIPYQANRMHYGWHWLYDFGTGDMGNDGVHDIDIALWGLGVDVHPSIVTAGGGKFYFDDDQQFPDTQYVVCDFPGDGAWGTASSSSSSNESGAPTARSRTRTATPSTAPKECCSLGKGDGWKLFGPKNQLRESQEKSGMGLPHYRNFLAAIQNGSRPNADIEIGHRATAVCHLGNIATRLGRTLHFDPATEQIAGDAEANRASAAAVPRTLGRAQERVSGQVRAGSAGGKARAATVVRAMPAAKPAGELLPVSSALSVLVRLLMIEREAREQISGPRQ